MSKILLTLLLSLGAFVSSIGGGVSSLIQSIPGRSQVAQVGGSGNAVQFNVDKFGLTSLSANGTTYITSSLARGISAHHIGGIGFSNGTSLYQDQTSMKSRTVDADGQGMTLVYSWGTLNVRYVAEGNKLRINHTLTNSTTSTTSITSFNLLSTRNFQFASTPTPNGFDVNNLEFISSGATGSVTVGSAKVVMAFSDMSKNTRLSFTPWYDYYGLGVQVKSGINSPLSIAPGQSYTFTLSYYFGQSTDTNDVLAADSYKKFTDLFPMKLQWNDTRPIIRDFISEGTKRSATNPRGYLKESSLDISSSSGITRLRTKILSGADANIKLMRDINSQGIIIWDLEGQEFDHVFTYVGAPDKLPLIAPEMDGIADELFKKYTDAGFRVGMTIRPQRFGAGTTPPATCTYAAYPLTPIFIDIDALFGQKKLACNSSGAWYVAGGSWQEVVDDDQVIIEELSRKIAYAKNRWGATLFYIDSNAYNGKGAYNASVFEEVQRRNPEVLLIPEIENTRYFASTAPYNQTNMGFSNIPSWVAPVYPNAKTVIYMGNLSDAQYNPVFGNFVNGVRNKNVILMIDWCCSAKDSQRVKDIYAAATAGVVYTPSSTPDPDPISTTPVTPNTPFTPTEQYTPPVYTPPTNTLISNTPISITLFGNNPAYIQKGNQFNDPGVRVVGSVDYLFKIKANVNGKEVGSINDIQLNTRTLGTSTIIYSVTDSQNKTASATRTVVVYDEGKNTSTPPPVYTLPELPASTNVALSRTLFIGSEGVDVSTLQQFLIMKGYLSAETAPRGYFGVATREAVKKYQCSVLSLCSGDEGSTGYGMVGQKTRASINSSGNASTVTMATQATQSSEDSRIKGLMEQIAALLKVIEQLKSRLDGMKR